MRQLLITCYWIGIIAAEIATLLLFFPELAMILLNPQPFESSETFLYVARIAGSLMLGWTVLLFWASRKPVERCDILGLTIFPVVTLLATSAILAVISNCISLSKMLPIFFLYSIVYSMFIPSYLWAKKQKI